jgi:spermidine/putrescine transport system permease protein
MLARKRTVLQLLIGPGAMWLLLFFIIPSFLVVIYSFLERQDGGGVIWNFSFEAYQKLFGPAENGLWVNDFMIIFMRSFWWALLTSAVCLLVGYPLAYFIVLQPPHRRNIYLFLVLVPFWTNFLVRTYAWKFILNNNGLLNTILRGLDFEPVSIINTSTAVLIGLVYGNLPFMVLPLYASIEKLDFSLIEAAQDGGFLFKGIHQSYFPCHLTRHYCGYYFGFYPRLWAICCPHHFRGWQSSHVGQYFGPTI